MAQSIYFINNRFISSSKACLPVSDLSIMRGYGVFEFLVTYHQKPFLLREHLKRLENSAEKIDLELPKTLEQIQELILKTLKKNRSKEEKSIRIIVTGGESLPPAFIRTKGKAGLIITVDPKHQYPKACYQHGVKIITYNHCRTLPEAKTIDYLIAIKAQKQAKKQGAIEAIYLCNGKITEGTTSNFFAVVDHKIITPGQKILLGITRRQILKLCKNFVLVEERPIFKTEITKFQEAFITSSSKEVMPVVQINKFRIGKDKTVKPGPITQKLMAKFRAFINKKRASF